MKLIIILSAVSAILVGCGSDGGSSAESAKAQSPVNQPPPQSNQQAPTDYSKVMCKDQADCTRACSVQAPTVSEDEIRNDICARIPGTSETSCNNLVSSAYRTFTQVNMVCTSRATTDVIETADIGSQACSTNSSCATICGLLYRPTTDQAIERAAAAQGSYGGSTMLMALVQNHIYQAQRTACLAAPASYVIRSALPN
jgi:hypothetical protein